MHSLSSHVTELLELSLRKNVTTLTTRAFSLLTNINDTVIKALFDSNAIVDTLNQIFNDSEKNNQNNNDNDNSDKCNYTDMIVINRFAIILQTCCLNNPELAKNAKVFTFVPKFLKFCHYRSVFEMLKSFLNVSEDKAKEIQMIFLKGESNYKNNEVINEFEKINFVENLLELIKKLPADFSVENNNPDSDQCQMAAALFKLVPLFKGTCLDELLTSSNEAFEIISRPFSPKNTPLNILNFQWEAIACLISPENSESAVKLSERLFSLLAYNNNLNQNLNENSSTGNENSASNENSSADNENSSNNENSNENLIISNELNKKNNDFYPYQESIIKILGKLAVSNVPFRTMLIDWEIGDKLKNIVLSHPKHSIAHLAITNFVVDILEIPELALIVLPKLYEVLNSGFEDTQTVELRAFAWNLQRAIREKTQDYVNLENFDDNLRGKINQLSNVISNSYGGDLPQSWNDSNDDDIRNLTPDQLMALLRFITGGRR